MQKTALRRLKGVCMNEEQALRIAIVAGILIFIQVVKPLLHRWYARTRQEGENLAQCLCRVFRARWSFRKQ